MYSRNTDEKVPRWGHLCVGTSNRIERPIHTCHACVCVSFCSSSMRFVGFLASLRSDLTYHYGCYYYYCSHKNWGWVFFLFLFVSGWVVRQCNCRWLHTTKPPGFNIMLDISIERVVYTHIKAYRMQTTTTTKNTEEPFDDWASWTHIHQRWKEYVSLANNRTTRIVTRNNANCATTKHQK